MNEIDNVINALEHVFKSSSIISDSYFVRCFVFTRVLCICGNATHLATGSLDRTIIIWSISDGKLCQKLVGHTKGVWALKFLSTVLLISGAYDKTIKVLI